jgi:putative transposase
MISFKCAHFPKDVILYDVFFHVKYGLSYRDLSTIMEESGVKVDHFTLNRRVTRTTYANPTYGSYRFRGLPLKPGHLIISKG